MREKKDRVIFTDVKGEERSILHVSKFIPYKSKKIGMKNSNSSSSSSSSSETDFENWSDSSLSSASSSTDSEYKAIPTSSESSQDSRED